MQSDATSLHISIAGLPIELSLGGCEPSKLAQIKERYEAFLLPPRRTPLTVQIRVEPGPAFVPTHSAGTWQIRSTVRGGRLEFASHFELGWVDWTAGHGSLLMRPEGDPENFLRVVYAWRLLGEGSLMLHACGVVRRGVGYVFFGPSGSGKTTIASLSRDHTILSDDIVVVKRSGERFQVCGVPFRGEMPEATRTNATAELGGLFTLVKDTEHRIELVAPAEAVARLAACAPFVMARPESTREVMEVAAALRAAVPMRALHFRRDSGFWRVIDGSE